MIESKSCIKKFLDNNGFLTNIEAFFCRKKYDQYWIQQT